MADGTSIEWTDASWVTITGCTHVSSGCDHCYAEALTARLRRMGQPKYAAGFDVVRCHEAALTAPLSWRKPRRIFVNSMADTFHVGVPQAFVDRLFAVMALTSQHTYQILTKRPQRAANYLSAAPLRQTAILAAMEEIDGETRHELTWPLPNVWIGTSVEDGRVTHRIDALRRCPAAVRFLSCEPLLGPLPDLDLTGIGWVIVGGESGAQHRPCDSAWVRGIRDQCVAEAVPLFFKQWGGLTPKSGGRLLDGLEWSQFPDVNDG